MTWSVVQDGVAGALPTYYGTRDALVRIFQDEGWRALYAGIAPALLGAGRLLPLQLDCSTDSFLQQFALQNLTTGEVSLGVMIIRLHFG